MIMPSDIRIAKVPTIFTTGFELHQGAFGGLVSPGVTVKAVGSAGSSGSNIDLDSVFRSLASCCGLGGACWLWYIIFWMYCGRMDTEFCRCPGWGWISVWGAGRAAPTGRSVLGKRWNSPSSTLGEVEGRRGLEDEQDKTEDFFLMYLDRNFSGSLTEPSELFSYIIAILGKDDGCCSVLWLGREMTRDSTGREDGILSILEFFLKGRFGGRIFLSKNDSLWTRESSCWMLWCIGENDMGGEMLEAGQNIQLSGSCCERVTWKNYIDR